MRAATFLLLLALAACARPAPAPESFRLAGAPIASTTRGEPQALAGEWQVAAAYPGPGPGAGQPVRVSFGPSGGMALGWQGGGWQLTPAGPGRWEGPEGPLWLLWADESFRIAVLGTPDGSFGFILTRPAVAGRGDLLTAAREMLDFNGYDLTRLPG
ncbi:lipocalin [Pseudoroseicyclus sp. CXY001]|uniref:lipocalin n=1 Tax=Pseudoroseicyclus sp. CXY001 TaxID=3242492 RepID=UPI00358DA7DB